MKKCVQTCALQPRPGTYVLLLASATDTVVRVGRLGHLRLQPGFYLYAGSALGPGGVRARLAHHMRPAQRPHWHIDYLRVETTLEEVWFCYDRKSREHHWARFLAAMRGASMPMAGFGSSDCGCESHLSFFQERPSSGDFFGGLEGLSQKKAYPLTYRHFFQGRDYAVPVRGEGEQD